MIYIRWRMSKRTGDVCWWAAIKDQSKTFILDYLSLSFLRQQSKTERTKPATLTA